MVYIPSTCIYTACALSIWQPSRSRAVKSSQSQVLLVIASPLCKVELKLYPYRGGQMKTAQQQQGGGVGRRVGRGRVILGESQPRLVSYQLSSLGTRPPLGTPSRQEEHCTARHTAFIFLRDPNRAWRESQEASKQWTLCRPRVRTIPVASGGDVGCRPNTAAVSRRRAAKMLKIWSMVGLQRETSGW